MATKRPAASGDPVGVGPPSKKLSLAMSPLDIGPAAGEEDLELKVLQVLYCIYSIVTVKVCIVKGPCTPSLGAESQTE